MSIVVTLSHSEVRTCGMREGMEGDNMCKGTCRILHQVLTWLRYHQPLWAIRLPFVRTSNQAMGIVTALGFNVSQ